MCDLVRMKVVGCAGLVLRWGMLNDCAAGKGNLSVADIGHLELRHVRSPSASPPRNLAFENIGPLLHGCDGSRTFEKWISHKTLSRQNASDQQRPASGQTELLKYWAMWSVNMIGDSGEIKGVRCG